MNIKKFETYLDERLALIRKVLVEKRSEYADNENVFQNFEMGSRITEECVEKVIFNYMLKHYVSYLDIVKKLNTSSDVQFDSKFINEKFGDIINYFILSEIYILENRCGIEL